MIAFVAIQSPLPTMMTHGANPSCRDWKDFSLLVMPIERFGHAVVVVVVEKRGNKRRKKSGSSWVLMGPHSFCGDSISFARDDDARHQSFAVGLEGFQPPRDADRAGGHVVVDVDGREAR